MRKLFLIGMMLLLFSNCSIDVRDKNKATTIKDSTIISPTIVYECPMQCENKVFADSGICPICKMDLMAISK